MSKSCGTKYLVLIKGARVGLGVEKPLFVLQRTKKRSRGGLFSTINYFLIATLSNSFSQFRAKNRFLSMVHLVQSLVLFI